MTEWKEYTGSDGQIAEMRQSEHGFVARNTSSVSSIMSIKLNQLFISGQKNPYLPELFGNKVSEFLNYNNTTHYLICDPHPLADMICQQARTGQPVYWKEKPPKRKSNNWSCDFIPWHRHEIYEFSFTPFEE